MIQIETDEVKLRHDGIKSKYFITENAIRAVFFFCPCFLFVIDKSNFGEK